MLLFSAVEEEGVGAADEREEAEGEEEEEIDEEDEVSSEESSSSEESGAEDEGADDEGPEDEEEEEEAAAADALPISKEQQEAEEEDLGKVCYNYLQIFFSMLNCGSIEQSLRVRHCYHLWRSLSHFEGKRWRHG